MRARLMVVTVLAVVVAVRPAWGQDDFKPAIEWFDTLGYPDLSKVELVKVATGQSLLLSGRPPEKEYRTGFLLATEGESFKILTLGLHTEWYTKRGTTAHEPADLKRAVADYLKSLTKRQNADEHGRFLGARLDGTDLFVLAYACAKRGLAEEAKFLFTRLKSDLRSRRIEKAESFRQDVIDYLAVVRMFALYNAIADPKVSRPELLARFEKFVKDYPGARWRASEEQPPGMFAENSQAMARSYIRVLKKMVAEDAERARHPPKPEAQMTRDERIADLIYRLRDQRKSESGFEREFDSGAATELIKIGLPAVPRLILALDDDRLTRIVAGEVMRVGSSVSAIIEELAGVQFIIDGRRPTIDAWWADIQQKGEKQALIDAVAAGGPYLGRRPEMLVKKYPDDAANALAKGIANTKDEDTRCYLLHVAADVKGDAMTPLLLEHLKAPRLRVRLEAAKALSKRGLDDGMAPMIEVWRKSATGDAEEDDSLDGVITFLVACRRADAIKALGTGLLIRSRSQQGDVIGVLGNLGRDEKQPLPPAVTNARDEVLVQELSNTERSQTAGRFSDDEPQVDSPRLCDLAAFYLSLLWKPKTPFRFFSPLLTRERYRVDLINMWRERQGQPPLPIPVSRAVKRLTDAVMKPRLDALLATKDDAERRRALQAIEDLGLPALPAAREFLAGLPAEHAAHAELTKLVSRLACVVNAIEFTPSSATPDEPTRKRLEEFRGKVVDVAALSQFARTFTKPLPAGIAGLRVAIEREGDDSGVTLRFKLVKGDYERREFGTYQAVDVDGRFAYGSGSGYSYESGVWATHWDDFRKELQRAFELGPEKQVHGRASIVLRNPGRD